MLEEYKHHSLCSCRGDNFWSWCTLNHEHHGPLYHAFQLTHVLAYSCFSVEASSRKLAVRSHPFKILQQENELRSSISQFIFCLHVCKIFTTASIVIASRLFFSLWCLLYIIGIHWQDLAGPPWKMGSLPIPRGRKQCKFLHSVPSTCPKPQFREKLCALFDHLLLELC